MGVQDIRRAAHGIFHHAYIASSIALDMNVTFPNDKFIDRRLEEVSTVLIKEEMMKHGYWVLEF